jgi:hypothetical protein
MRLFEITEGKAPPITHQLNMVLPYGIEAGRVYYWNPREVRGKDHRTYDIITITEHGDANAEQRKYIALTNPQPIRVKVLEPSKEFNVRKSVNVVVLGGLDQQASKYNMRPYVDEDGQFDQLDPDEEHIPLKDVVGFYTAKNAPSFFRAETGGHGDAYVTAFVNNKGTFTLA